MEVHFDLMKPRINPLAHLVISTNRTSLVQLMEIIARKNLVKIVNQKSALFLKSLF